MFNTIIKKQKLFILISFILLSIKINAVPEISFTQDKIGINENKQEIGSISFYKIPLTGWYIFYDFYIEPKFRNKGFGKTLLKNSINYLIDLKATRIYIQPGPYELTSGAPENYSEKIQRLIKLYSSFGFIKVSRFFSKLAYLLYWVCSIKEDPQYLMVYNIFSNS